MATATIRPNSDTSTSGTLRLFQIRVPTGAGDKDAGSYTGTYADVDEVSMEGDSATDYILTPNAAGGGYYLFTFPAFSLPSGATIISVSLMHYLRDDTSGANAARGRLKVGGNYYDSATNRNPGTTATRFLETWTTNPKTTAAWTPAQINGTDGTNDLQQFGWSGTDFSPAFRLCAIYCLVRYTEANNYYQGVKEASINYRDGLSLESTNAYATFGFTSPNVPAGATVTEVAVFYEAADFETAAGANNGRAVLTVGGTVYNAVDTGAEVPYTWGSRSYAFTQNPKTSTNWTVDDVNGVGANALQGIGVGSNDVAPIPVFAQIYAVITYAENTTITPPVVGLTSNRLTPYLDSGLVPPVQALSTTAFIAAKGDGLTVGLSSLATSLFVPIVTVAEAGMTLEVPAAALTTSLFSALLQEGKTVPVQSLATSLFTPTTQEGRTVPLATLSTAAYTPALNEGKTIPVLAVATGLLTPALAAGATVPVSTLSTTSFTPLRGDGKTVPVGSLSLSALTPNLGEGLTVGLASLVASALTPHLEQGFTVGILELTTGLFIPVVTVSEGGQEVVITPGKLALLLSALRPTAAWERAAQSFTIPAANRPVGTGTAIRLVVPSPTVRVTTE